MESPPNARVLKMSCPTFLIGMLLSYPVNKLNLRSNLELTYSFERIFHCQRDFKELS